ncbi:MAG: hypothetical protein FWD35_02895 [Oscillospiraceae bacterium]|nr:hypothetical protein [Oscillospiraceae bacterium]
MILHTTVSRHDVFPARHNLASPPNAAAGNAHRLITDPKQIISQLRQPRANSDLLIEKGRLL